MVKTLLDGLPAHTDVRLHHVDVRLSRDAADVGRARLGKLPVLLAACLRACWIRLRHGPAYFYYVPAPGKRSALYRDFVVMLLCRPWFSGLILHWHAVGLGAWLGTDGNRSERWLAQRLLGQAKLALVLSPSLTADAAVFSPQRIAIVPNCVPDPYPKNATLPPHGPGVAQILFLGLCSRSKGVFATLDAYDRLTRRFPGHFFLTIAGGFESDHEEREFHERLRALPPGTARFAGFADAAAKRALYALADVFCFPTTYAHEGQPLTVLEALAHDVPVVTTRWRALPDLLPAAHVWFVDPAQPEELVQALAAAAADRPQGALRHHYLAHYTPERHLDALAAALDDLNARAPRATAG